MKLAFVNKYSHINWALADQAMVSGVNFFTGILFARYLGLEEFGRFTLAWMIILFFNSFQLVGIIAPMMSIGPKQEKDKEAAYYGAVLAQQIFWSLACSFFLWVSVWLSGYIRPEWNIQSLGLPLAVTLLAWQLQDFIRRYFFVRGQEAMAFLNDAISYMTQLILLLLLFRIATLSTALVLWLIAGTSTLAVIVGLGRLGKISLPHGMFVQVLSKHWLFSKWLLASALLQWTSGNMFIIGAGSVLGPASVGALKAAQNIMGVSHIIFQGMENIVPTRASYHYHKGGWIPLINYLKKVTYWGGACTVMIVLVASLFSEFWLSLLYGNDYRGFGHVLQWYAVIYFLIFLGLPIRAGLRAIEHLKPIFVSYCLTTAFSLVLVKLLIGNFGLIGALSGILGTQIIYQASMSCALWRKGNSLR